MAPLNVNEASFHLMPGIIISAALLCAIMFIVARHEADYSFPKVLLISLGLGLCDFALSLLLPPLVGSLVVLGLTVWALHHFCYLRWNMAATVAGIYLGCSIGLGIVLGLLSQ